MAPAKPALEAEHSAREDGITQRSMAHTRRAALQRLITLCLAAVGCGGPVASGSRATDGRDTLAVVGARIYPSPTELPIASATVVAADGVITAVGPRGRVSVPAGATVLDGAGRSVTAGFWNTHVHFTEAKWRAAESVPASELTAALRAMLTRWGVVRVVDTGSLPVNTLALRRRIESGEVPGPQIVLASGSFVPVNGSPFYVLPSRLPELTSPEQAERAVNLLLDLGGIDAVKLFTGSFASPQSIVVMPVDIVRAAVGAAHRRGKLVFSHPSNNAGALAALEGGVDVLAHTFPSGEWDRALPRRMREANMALIPTLKLWPWELGRFGVPASALERVQSNAQAQVRAFMEAGGQLFFGTDVGYMTDYDPTDEYLLLERAGLSFPDVLSALTTAPARRLAAEAGAGRIAVGSPADLVVLERDPAADIRALADVRYTIRQGRVIYERAR
jgi:imidazolonepropionase-like amidohydrolase